MALTYADTERGGERRLISSGGNIYSVSSVVPKVGDKTRGRGFWTGKETEDEDNPDVDKPSARGAAKLIPREAEEGESDGFEDDKHPWESLRELSHITRTSKQQIKQGKKQADAVLEWGTNKALLTLGSVKVDKLADSPVGLSEEDLLKAAAQTRFMLDTAANDYERSVLKAHAANIAAELRKTIELRKAAPKGTAELDAEEAEKKGAKQGKAQTVTADENGKTQYKYGKSGDGKGPNSDGRKPEEEAQAKQDNQAAGEEPQAQDSGITPAAPIDPTKFAATLGVAPKQLESFAHKNTKRGFVDFFMRQPGLAEKHGITPSFLGRLYDSVISPPEDAQEAPQGPQAAPGGQGAPPMPGGPQMAMQASLGPTESRAIVIFNGATLNRSDLALVDVLKSHRAETVEDIRGCLQTHYACDAPTSVRATRTLLRKWAEQGIVSFYPGE